MPISKNREEDYPVQGKVDSSRMKRKKRVTREKLLKAAYKVMSRKGIELSTLKEITEEADIGFGTIYNYFVDKDEIAAQVLDCIINDIGRRNDIATTALKRTSPVLVISTSQRLVVREALNAPMWRWWVQRPDLLVDRMRLGFGPFGMRDLRLVVEGGVYSIIGDNLDATWNILMWMLVGGMRDVVMGDYPAKYENLMIESNLRVLGVPLDEAKAIANVPLPEYPEADIDFSFLLQDV
ncbi:MAG: TetR/AcrR family transcriptional regulator [Arenicellaceae bacterium]|nr:TetR/AcrR family transcriptional regulator [Arenicellaceae bacterium]